MQITKNNNKKSYLKSTYINYMVSIILRVHKSYQKQDVSKLREANILARNGFRFSGLLICIK